MGETRVDLLHLLEDLRDAYPGALEETILTEIVANCLDSRATRVALTTDPARATLTVVDDGSGMARRELARFHDIATTTKTRGEGIGFAGVGIKLGLLACEEVLTETRRGKTHVATTWHLLSRHRAPWRWVPPPGLTAEHGTAVRLLLRNPLSPLLDGGFIAGSVERHFRPLLDETFDDCLRAHYPRGVGFVVNGNPLPRRGAEAQRAPLSIRLGRKRKPVAVGYLARDGEPLSDEQRGVAISTLGKVIKRGWDWLGLSPASADRVSGLIEVPGLAGSLTLNKGDFIRTGARGATYLAYRKAIQEAVSAQLAAWGELPHDRSAEARRRVRPVERDLQSVLVDLADDFPLLAALVDRQAGGQRRLPVGRPGEPFVPVSGSPGFVAPELPPEAAPEPIAAPMSEPAEREPEPRTPTEAERGSAAAGPAAGGPRGRRPGRYGLTIQFESRPEDTSLGRLVESTVWVNEAHPAHRRAVASRSEGYHIALAVAMALAPLAVEPKDAQGFITAFLTRWGGILERGRPRRRSRR